MLGTLVAAEMVAAQEGIGVMVLNAAEFLVTDVVATGIVNIGILHRFRDGHHSAPTKFRHRLVSWLPA